MFDYTPDQVAALLQDEGLAKLLLEFGDFQICSGDSPISWGGKDYDAVPMNLGSINYGDLGIRTKIEIGDEYNVFTIANYEERFAGKELTWTLLIRNEQTGQFEEVNTILWYVRYCQWDKGTFRLNCFGNTGFKRRAGLSVMSRFCDLKFKGESCGYVGAEFERCNGSRENCIERGQQTQFRGFRFAPNAGDSIVVGDSSSVSFNPPPESSGTETDGSVDYPPWMIGGGG